MNELNFKKTDEIGAQYHRANKITLENSGENNRLTIFNVEQVTNTALGGQVKVDDGFIYSRSPTGDELLDDVELVDLQGNVLGHMPAGKMYDAVLLYINSYMIHIARQQNRLAE